MRWHRTPTTGPVIAGRWEIKVCRHWRSLRGENWYLRLIFSVNRAGCPVSDPPQIEPESLVTQTVINISLCKSHALVGLSGTSKLLEEEEKATFTSALKLWWISLPLLQVTGSSLCATGIHLHHPPHSTEVMAAPSATLKAKQKSSPQKCGLCEPFCLHAADWVQLSAVGLRQSLSDLQKNRNRVTPWTCGNLLGIIYPTNIKRCAYFFFFLFTQNSWKETRVRKASVLNVPTLFSALMWQWHVGPVICSRQLDMHAAAVYIYHSPRAVGVSLVCGGFSVPDAPRWHSERTDPQCLFTARSIHDFWTWGE